jgi:hypothetical protein
MDNEKALKLIDEANIIGNMYNKLYLLDVKKNTDAQLYDDLIEFITEEIKKEDKIYNSIKIEDIPAYFNYFGTMYNNTSDLRYDSSKPLFYSESAYMLIRPINKLKKIIDENNIDFINSADEDSLSDEQIKYFNDFLESSKIQQLEDFVLLKSKAYLAESLKKINNEPLRCDVIKYFYLTPYYCKGLENEFLIQRFYLDADYINYSINDYNSLKYAYDATMGLIEILIYKQYKNKNELLVYLSILKSYLCLLPEQTIVDIINKLYKVKSNDEENHKVKTKIIKEMKDVLNRYSN